MAALCPLFRVVASASFVLAPALVSAQGTQPTTHNAPKAAKPGLPLVFEGNEGQYPAGLDFVGRTERYSVAIGARDIRFALPGKRTSAPVVLSLRGAQETKPVGLAEAPFRTNYYIGSKPSEYHLGVHNYNRVGLNGVYPGINVQFYAAGNTIEHDFLIAPGADASRIAMDIASQGRRTSLDAAGDLVVKGEEGDLRLNKPVAYQLDAKGKRHPVPASFLLASNDGGHELRFHLGAYDHSRPLVIDPLIQYATFVDGNAGSSVAAVALDSSGDTYLTGYTNSTTSSFTGYPAAQTSYPLTLLDPTTRTGSAAFLVKFNPLGSATQVAWLDFYAGSSGDTKATSLAVQPGATPLLLAMGGTTAAPDLPTLATSAEPAVVAAGNRGFAATFLLSTGVLTAATYVDGAPGVASATTVVNGVALDAAGDVFSVGSTTGATLAVTANAFAVPSAVVTSSTTAKGFIFELASTTLAAGPFVSYLAGTAVANTSLTAVTVDSAGANIWVGGYTLGNFPLAGPYDTTMMNTHNGAGNDSFVAQVVPGSPASSLLYSTWFAGSGDDGLTSLTLDSSGNLFAFGQTASTDLFPANTLYTYSGSTPVTTPTPEASGATPVTGTFPTKTAPATLSGFVAKLDNTGKPLVVTYIGGSGNDVVNSGAVSSTGLVYAAGTSTSPSKMSYNSATVLPFGEDNTSMSSQRGYVLQLPGTLSAVNYVANLGGAAGPDTAVGVAADSSGNAYVGANITSTSAYTSSGAVQGARQAHAAPAGYLAVVQPQASTLPITLSAVACPGLPPTSPQTGCPDPIAFPNGSGTLPAENVTYTFSIASSGGSASVLQNLVTTLTVGTPTGAGGTPPLTYNSVTLTDTTTPSNTYTCTGATATGYTCLIAPGYPATGGVLDTFSLVVNATLTAQPPAAMTAISVPVTLADVSFDTQNVIEVSNVAIPAQLSIALTTQSPASAGTVFTTNSSTPTPGKTQVSYTFTVANAAGAGGDATGVNFNFPAVTNGLIVTGITSNSTTGSCVPGGSSASTCSNLSVAHAASITVTVTGVYPDSALAPGTGTGGAANFTVTASGSFSYPALAVTPNLTLHRGVHLALSAPAAGSFNAPAGSDGHFRLGENVTYSVTATNNGPSGSLASADTVSVTYPAGFTVTATSTGDTCTTSPCTLSAPAIGSGSNATVSITGNFPDVAANAGITGTTATTKGFSSSAAESTAATPLDYDSGGTPGDNTNSASTSVERVVSLTIATPSITPPATACSTASNCLYMQNTGINDHAGYSFTLTNNGPNVAVGATFTIVLPSAPANPAGTNHPLVSSTPSATVTPSGSVANFGTALTCTYAGGAGVTPANNKINCSGNLAPGNVVVTGQLTVDASTVPAASTSVTTSATAGSATATVNAVGTAPAAQGVPTVEVDRAAHLVAKMSLAPSLTAPATTLNLDETGTATAGKNDTLAVTTAVDSVPLNTVSATLSIVLPKWFRLASLPALTTAGGAVATSCTVGGAALALPYTTNATPPTLVCAITTLPAGGATPPSGGAGAVLNTQQVKVVFNGKFLDNGAGADITGTSPTAKVNSLTASLGSATVTFANAVDAYPTYTADASTTSSFAVQRLVNMHIRKTRNNFGSATAPNLDEHPGSNTLGTNDEIEYEVALGNSGVNQAVGIQFTDTLPPYFTVTGLFPIAGASTAPDARNVVPTTLAVGSMACYLGTSASGTPITLPLTTPITTGAASQAITCTYGETATVPLALPATSYTVDFQSTAVELVYQGKFQDNAPAVDDIPASTNSYTTPASTANVTTAPYSLDPNDGETGAGPTFSVQRSAHLTLTAIPGITDARTYGAVTAAGEAQPSITSPGNFVYNCVRFTAILQNTGKNIARTPQMSVTLPYKFVLSSVESAAVTTISGANTLSTGCAYGTSAGTTVTAPSSLAPTSETTATSGLLVDFDGYFDTDALGVVKTNSTSAGLTFASLSDSSIVDPGPAFTSTPGPTVAVVNTPYGTNFTVKPYSGSATQPVVVSFNSVGSAGATTLGVSTSYTTMPQGVSRDPRYTAKMNLYQPGTAAPLSYTMGTSAGTVAGTTGLCFTNPAGGALTDTFFKPERVLLWALSGLPGGVTVATVPNITTPYTGDVTTSVVPVGGGSYVQAGLQYYATGGHTPVFPAVQAQPQMVCGQVAGFAPAAAPVIFQLLEPVNLPPYIIPNSGSITTPPGKGVSEVSYLFPTSHDYNDADPCFVQNSSGVVGRNSCDDNLVLTTRLFGADKLVPAQSHAYGPLTPDQAAAYSATVFEVQASATFFPVVTDELGELNYQLAGGGSVSTAGSTSNCDPGAPVYAATPSLLYAPGTTCTSETVGTFSGTPSQAAVNFTANAYKTPLGGTDMAQLVPSTTGGSSPLIVLPDATTPTSSNSGVINSGANAAGTVNAGQSVGFLWKLSNILKNATFTNITCYQVNSSDLTTKVPFSNGISCLAPSTNDTTFGDPAVYVSTQSGILYSKNGASGWRMVSGVVFAGLMIPLLLFRRRLKVAGQVAIIAVLSLGALTGLTGCGTGSTIGVGGTTATTAASGTYWFRLSATQTTGGTTTTYYSTAFKVTVVNGS